MRVLLPTHQVATTLHRTERPVPFCRVVEAERDEIQDEKFVQEKKMEELQETLDALQDEAEANKEALIGRIQFLSHELEERDKDSHEAVC